MKKLFCSFLFYFTLGLMAAQPPVFQSGVNMQSNSYATECLASATDASGNLYVTGYFTGNTEFNSAGTSFTLSAGGDYDIFVAKYDPAGILLWAKSIGGTGSYNTGWSIQVDNIGSCYVAGEFEGAADFDPGSGTATLTVGGFRDIFLLKLDASGNYIWAKNIGGSGGSSNGAQNLKMDNSGNLYVTGYFGGPVDFDPGAGVSTLSGNGAFVMKMDTLGNYVWAHDFAGPGYDTGNTITVDAAGNVYASGAFSDSVDFDPGPSVVRRYSAGLADAYLVKLDAAGNFSWVTTVGSTDYDWAYGLGNDAAGNIYFSSSFVGTVDLDPGAGVATTTSAGGADVFILKLDPSGNYIWSRRIGGTGDEQCLSMAINADDEIYVGGTFQGSVDFDPSVGTSMLSGTGSQNGYLLKLNSAGSFDWAGGMFPSASLSVICRNVSVGNNGGLSIAGFFIGAATLDPTAGAYFVSATTAYYSGFAVNMSETISTSVQESFTHGGLFLYPNPSNGIFNLTSTGNAEYVIYSAQGKLIRSGKFENDKTPFDLSDQANGIYFLNVKNEAGDYSVKKIVKQ